MQATPLLVIGSKLPIVQELCDSLIENNEEVQVHHAATLEEADQMYSKLQPVVMLSTDIMIILKLLMKNKEQIRKSSSKSILYNEKGALPEEVSSKLLNSGLTDELSAQTALKTLHYKVSLYLKSLPKKDDKGELVLKRLTPQNKKKVQKIKSSKSKTGKVQVETDNGVVDPVVLEVFCDENSHYIKEAERIIERIEDEEVGSEALKDYTLLIGRIVDTSATLGLDGLFVFCSLAKAISEHIQLYSHNKELQDIVIGILGDATTFLNEVIDQLRDGDDSAMQAIGKKGIVKRLKWLSEKFKIDSPSQIEGKPKSEMDDLIDALDH